MPFGTPACTSNAATSEAAATIPMAMRHPRRSPTHAASGMPATEASAQPMNTKVMARPRWAGVLMKPMVAAAWGVNTAADNTVRARTGHSHG